MTLEARPCDVCQALAYTGRHEPYLVDDIPMRLKFWRCSSCGALWCEREHSVVVVEEAEADLLIPGWRDNVHAPRRGSLAELLRAYADGEVDDAAFITALLRHEVWVAAVIESPTDNPEDVVLFSAERYAAAHGVSSAVAVPAAAALGRTSAGRVVIDPCGPQTVLLDGSAAWTLVHEAARANVSTDPIVRARAQIEDVRAPDHDRGVL